MSFISFSSVLWFSIYRSYTSLIEFVLKYFIFLLLLGTRLFSSFFLDHSFPMYIRYTYVYILCMHRCTYTTDLCMLLLYPATLLSLLALIVFLMDSSGYFLIYTIMSSVKRDAFTSSFPVWVPFNYPA